jgi:hypothetical protein
VRFGSAASGYDLSYCNAALFLFIALYGVRALIAAGAALRAASSRSGLDRVDYEPPPEVCRNQ